MQFVRRHQFWFDLEPKMGMVCAIRVTGRGEMLLERKYSIGGDRIGNPFDPDLPPLFAMDVVLYVRERLIGDQYPTWGGLVL